MTGQIKDTMREAGLHAEWHGLADMNERLSAEWANAFSADDKVAMARIDKKRQKIVDRMSAIDKYFDQQERLPL